MPPISPVQTSDRTSGFTLIEVIVAVAVAAMTIAACSSAILVSRKIEAASIFYRSAYMAAGAVQASDYGIDVSDAERDTKSGVEIEKEAITSDPAGRIPAWTLYTLRSPEADRRISLAIRAGSGEN